VKVGYSSLCQIFSRKATEPGQELGYRNDCDTRSALWTIQQNRYGNFPITVLLLRNADLAAFSY
jgi:hypothetical protein